MNNGILLSFVLLKIQSQINVVARGLYLVSLNENLFH